MVTRLAFVAALAVLAACGSINPYNLPEGQGAYLQNQEVIDGRTLYRNQFIHVNGEYLDVGIFTTKNVYEAKYTIPFGEVSANMKVDYFPRLPLSYANPRLIRSTVAFVAAEGQTYRIACEVKDNLAYIWIEDVAGNQVSETVTAVDYFGVVLTDPAP